MISKKQVEDVLKTIPDPELNVSIWDLGLVYGIKIDKEKGFVTVTMTLTTIGCPLFDMIKQSVVDEVKDKVKGVKKVEVDLTFDPPWNPDKMSKEAKLLLGFA